MSNIEEPGFKLHTPEIGSDTESEASLELRRNLAISARRLLEPQPSRETQNDENDLSDITVIMPIAGRATRASEITRDAIPKHLIRLGNGETILDTITGQLQAVGFRRFVFCVGFLKEQLIDHIKKEEWATRPDTTYAFDETDRLLGPDGTILHAIGNLGLRGQGLLIPGDVMLPWKGVAAINHRHRETGADITFGVTSHTTERTTDVGKIVVEDTTGRLLWGYGRTEDPPHPDPGTRNLTSAPSHVISIERFAELCYAYREAHPERALEPLNLRDDMLPWIRQNGGFDVRAFDIEGEVLDLGTPETIKYGQENWRRYVADFTAD